MSEPHDTKNNMTQLTSSGCFRPLGVGPLTSPTWDKRIPIFWAYNEHFGKVRDIGCGLAVLPGRAGRRSRLPQPRARLHRPWRRPPTARLRSRVRAHHRSGSGSTHSIAIELCGDGAQSRRCQPGPEPQRRDGTKGERDPHNLPLANVVVTSWPSSVNTGVHGFNALAVVTRR